MQKGITNMIINVNNPRYPSEAIIKRGGGSFISLIPHPSTAINLIRYAVNTGSIPATVPQFMPLHCTLFNSAEYLHQPTGDLMKPIVITPDATVVKTIRKEYQSRTKGIYYKYFQVVYIDHKFIASSIAKLYTAAKHTPLRNLPPPHITISYRPRMIAKEYPPIDFNIIIDKIASHPRNGMLERVVHAA